MRSFPYLKDIAYPQAVIYFPFMENTRYGFGDNWYDFISNLNPEQISIATSELKSLIGDIAGKTFLDIGSGSGLHSLSALGLGAAHVMAIDYDPMSVKSTHTMLTKHAPEKSWEAHQGDILANPLNNEKYDVVYSWGVLHHTGDMWKAIKNATKTCKNGGLFAIALYTKTPFCTFWKHEKRIYSKYKLFRPVLDGIFITMLLLRKALAGINPLRYVSEYKSNRGMNFFTDIRDWLGGYPYESVSDAELDSFLTAQGFILVKKQKTSPSIGVFGSSCGEWVYKKL